MPLRHRLVLLLLLVAGLVCELPAQDAGCQRRTIAVNVLDRTGNQVSGLGAADFQGEFRGQPLKVSSSSVDNGPRRVVMLLDTSGSMMDSQREWQLVRRVTHDLVLNSSSEMSLALLTFSAEIGEKVGFDAGRQAVAGKLAALPGEKAGFGKGLRPTALFDAILEAVSLLEPTRLGDSVYVVTDGWDNASRSRSKDAERMLLQHGIRLFGFVLSDPRFDMTLDLVPLVRTSGGNSFNFNPYRRWVIRPVSQWYSLSEEEELALAVVLRRVYAQMAEFYRVEVELPQEVDKPRKWRLEVVDAHGKKRKDLTVVYPRKLMPCAVEEPRH